MLTTIGIIIGIILLKFVYDTYLTNNTERRFEEYRTIDPLGAAEIEPPKDEEGFNDLIEEISDRVSYRQSQDIKDVFPEFVEQYEDRLTIIESNSDALSYMSISEDFETVIAILRSPNLEYYLTGFLTREGGNRIDGKKIRLGNLYEIERKQINWKELVTELLTDLGNKADE